MEASLEPFWSQERASPSKHFHGSIVMEGLSLKHSHRSIPMEALSVNHPQGSSPELSEHNFVRVGYTPPPPVKGGGVSVPAGAGLSGSGRGPHRE